jgi:hypothetical protein
VAEERAEKEKLLKQVWQLYLAGRIELYFGDESAFSMKPCLPYGWSPKGERVGIFPQRDKKINLFGLFRPDNFCVTYESAENICRYVDKPTVLVIDNAPTHRSETFLSRLGRRTEKDLYLFFLPRYSPHLNKAETYWRKAKYEWLKPADYGSFAKFRKKIYYIFNQVGSEYKVAFKELHPST